MLKEVKKLNKIGIALSTEKNINNILELIVDESMNITNADGGTLYLMIDNDTRLKFEILKNKEKKTGCTVHFVNEKLDGGIKIIQKSFFINKNDNEKILRKKTQKLEHRAFSEAIIKIFRYN